jgi:hypothetical protein
VRHAVILPSRFWSRQCGVRDSGSCRTGVGTVVFARVT